MERFKSKEKRCFRCGAHVSGYYKTLPGGKLICGPCARGDNK